MDSELKPLYRAIFPATNILQWLDGSSAAEHADMAPVLRRLQVVLDDPSAEHPAPPPADLKILFREGGFAFWQTGDAREVVEDRAGEADYLLAPRPAYRLRGTVSDPRDDYSPRRFDVEVPAIAAPSPAARAAIDNVVLYPTPKGARPGPGGAIRGTLRWQAGPGETRGARVPWALVEVTLAADSSVVFRALSDRNGDFVLAMPRLPAVSEGIPTQAVELAVRATAAADPEVWPSDPEGQPALDIGELKLEYPDEAPTADPSPDPIPFSDQPGLAVQPGKTGLIRTVQHDHVVIQAP